MLHLLAPVGGWHLRGLPQCCSSGCPSVPAGRCPPHSGASEGTTPLSLSVPLPQGWPLRLTVSGYRSYREIHLTPLNPLTLNTRNFLLKYPFIDVFVSSVLPFTLTIIFKSIIFIFLAILLYGCFQFLQNVGKAQSSRSGINDSGFNSRVQTLSIGIPDAWALTTP